MKGLPTWETYCENTTPGNALVFDLGAVRVYFSYKTPVAYSTTEADLQTGLRLVVRVNDWSNTTGKHLNAIDGGSKEAKARRVPGDVFETRLRAVLDRIERAKLLDSLNADELQAIDGAGGAS